MLAEVFRQAELPGGVVNVVLGNGVVTGSALVKNPQIKGISFTGGTATGIKIRKDTAADIYKHLSLELGGKNPTLVFDDVDMEKAIVTASMAAFENQGEVHASSSFSTLLKTDNKTDLPLWVEDLRPINYLHAICEGVYGICI